MSLNKNRKAVFKKKLEANSNEVIYTGNRPEVKTVITLIDLQKSEQAPKICTLEEIVHLSTQIVSTDSLWINVTGLSDTETITKIALQFGINTLLTNDLLNVYQRPKVEYNNNYIFVEVDRIQSDSSAGVAKSQISFLLTNNILLSFSETEPNYLTDLADFRDSVFKKSNYKCSILLYYIIDKLVDEYFVTIDDVVEQLEQFEEKIISGDYNIKLDSVIQCRKNIHSIRHSASPLKEILYSLQRNDNQFFDKEIRYCLNNTYEHLIQIVETIEVNRESIISLIDIYMSGLSIKLNDIMKVLTLIATIFMPLTFIVGLYGMNFVNQPEYKWTYGYGFAWFLIITVGLAFAWYFKKKNWF